MEEERKVTSIKVKPEIWRDAKILALRKGIDVSDLVEKALLREIKEYEEVKQ